MQRDTQQTYKMILSGQDHFSLPLSSSLQLSEEGWISKSGKFELRRRYYSYFAYA